jgi:hypothetical protein
MQIPTASRVIIHVSVYFGLWFPAFQVWSSGTHSPLEMSYGSPFNGTLGALMSPVQYKHTVSLAC